MKKSNDHFIFYLSITLYVVLIVMSLIFYQERLNIDTSYYFFKTLNEQNFHIEHQRYVLMLAEIPVWLGNAFHLPLKIIVQLYSLWHVLFYFILGIGLSIYYKKREYLLLFLLLQTIGILLSFVNPIFELYYGVALIATLYIILKNTQAYSYKNWTLFFILSFFIISSHPFNIILYLLIICLDFTDRKKFNIIIASLIGIGLIILMKSYCISPYEKGKMSWILDMEHNKTYLQLFELNYWKNHFLFLLKNYFDWLIILFAFLVTGWQQLSKIKFGTIVFFLLGTILLINFSFGLTEYSAYGEQIFFILVALVLIPFYLDIVPVIKNKIIKKIVFFILLLLVGVRLYKQIETGTIYQEKTKWMYGLIDKSAQKENCKALIPFSDNHKLSKYIGWDIPFTSMVFSSMNKKNNTISVSQMSLKDTSFFYSISKNDYFFRLRKIEPLSSLNKQYFKFCQQKKYKLLN